MYRLACGPIGLLLALWMLPGLGAAVWLQNLFGTRPIGIALHVIVVLGLLVILAVPWVIGPLTRAPLRLQRAGLALTLGTVQWALFCFYGLCGVGHSAWGGWPTSKLFWSYISRWSELADAAALSQVELAVAAGASWLVFIIIYFVLGGGVLCAFRRSRRVATEPAASRSERLVWLCAIAAAMMVGISLLTNRPLWIRNEPLQIARAGGWEGQLGAGESESVLIQAENHSIAQYHLMPRRPRPLRPLVLITIDSLRSDQMQVYGASRTRHF